MIPSLNQSGVLPPFLPEEGPTKCAAMAPYETSIRNIVDKFATTTERKNILKGLLDYREKLRKAGFVSGFQWVAGSYLEDCEAQRNRPPKDVDIVTFARRPAQYETQEAWHKFVEQNQNLFARADVMQEHQCDAYFVDLTLIQEVIVSRSRYWFGLFSHQRDTYLWKGILQISLQADDEMARQALQKEMPNA
jgi:hypothetical protein